MKTLYVAIFLLLPGMMAPIAQASPEQILVFGALSPGRQIHVARVRMQRPGSFGYMVDRIQLTSSGQNRVLQDLKELQGSVEIQDAATALKYVRLRTALSTWNLWPGSLRETEVIASEDLDKLPNFGLRNLVDPHPMSSGFLGILSNKAYHAYPFSPSTTQKEGNGFTITRWIFVADYTNRPEQKTIRQIREFVGKDGEYRRTELKRLAPPELPDTNWRFPGFA